MHRYLKKAPVLLLAVILAITGCAGDGAQGKQESQTQARQGNAAQTSETSDVTLKVVTMFGGTDPNAPVYEKIMQDFLEQNPNISIEDNSGTSDEQWKASVAASFSAGDEPDVLQFFTDATANQLVEMDKFVTLEEIQAEYPEYAKSTYAWALRQVANMDGVKRAVPTTGYWEGLYCNKDLFDRYGIALPDDWNSLVTAITEFQKHGIIPISCSLGNVPHYWMEYLLLYSDGVEEYRSSWKEIPQDSVNALMLFQTLREMGAFPENTDTISNDYAQELFCKKDAAMILEGNWFLSAVKDTQHTVVIPFPGVKDSKAPRGTIVGGMTSGFYITRRAWNDPAKRDAAVKFVMANTSQEAVQRYWEYGGAITTAATKVYDHGNRTPLALSARNYMQGAAQIVLSTDSRMAPRAYRELIAGIMKVSRGASARELLDKVMTLNP